MKIAFFAGVGLIILLSWILGYQHFLNGDKIVCVGGDEPIFCQKYLYEKGDRFYWQSDFTGEVYNYRNGNVYIRIK